MADLTRWNRAGLPRFDYLDGNAALLLERLRAGLAREFPHWALVQADPPADETDAAHKQRVEALYEADADDMLWQLTRQFARACHVLAGHVDAYANEAYLGTASQWDNLRRLVALLDYAPRPPASASTPLALLLKPGAAGTVAAGLQCRHSPRQGAPLVFETLDDLAADAACNLLRAREHGRNPQPVGLDAHTLQLDGRLERLAVGAPLVLEDERSGRLSAHVIESARPGANSTRVTVRPGLPADFARGWTLVHAVAKEQLVPLRPAASGVDAAGHALQLALPASGLAAGDIIVIRSGAGKPLWRRIKSVRGHRLVLHRAIGALNLAGATVAHPVTVPIAMLDAARGIDGGSIAHVAWVVGDWSRLAGQWLADLRVVGSGKSQREYLPAYHCIKANYVPVTAQTERATPPARAGYTALTLVWNRRDDGTGSQENLALNNPQTLLAPPSEAGAWPLDRFLNRSADGRLPPALVTRAGKKAAAGDLAVLLRGQQMAWARLASVALDPETDESTLTAAEPWQARGGGPFFLATSRVHTHFTVTARAVDWQDNDTPLRGRRLALQQLPPCLEVGRAVLVGNGTTTLATRVTDVDAPHARIELAAALPPGSSADNLRLYGNVVLAGHGETRPQRVLGSGDATRSNQQFTLQATDLSHVADASMDVGVRAALDVSVDGETWTQVASLKDSRSSDAHYQVRLDEDGNATIQFGDGRRGRRLPSGSNNVRARWRQGSGTVGNLPAGSFSAPARPHALIAELLQPLAASGGADRESNETLRQQAPATLLALERAVSLKDYAALARSHASIWQAHAFRRPPGLAQHERITVVVMAAGGGPLAPALKQDVQAYLAARAQPGVAIRVSDYERLTFGVTATVRVRRGAFDPNQVQKAVLQALQRAFSERERALGQLLYRSEVYQVVEGVAGVENSDCQIHLPPPAGGGLPAREARVDGALLTAAPAASQCLVFDAAASAITIQEWAP